MKPHKTCTRRHRITCHIFLFLFFGALVSSGFARFSGHGILVWPLSESWFVFYTDTDRFYKPVVSGVLTDGKTVTIDMNRWFKMPVAFESWRYGEMRRNDHHNVIKLADYVCRQYNREAADGNKLTHISIKDVSWLRTPGEQRYLKDVPDQEKIYHTVIDQMLCPIK